MMLADMSLPRLLPPDIRATLVASFEPESFAAGMTIVQEAAGVDALYVVIEGRVHVSRIDHDGAEASIAAFGPGFAFGRIGGLPDRACAGTVRATSDVRLLRLDAAVFSALLESRPELQQHLDLQNRQQRLYSRFRQVTGPVLRTGTDG